MRKLLPVILALVGVLAGGGAGLLLRPAPEEVVVDPCGNSGEPAHDASVAPGGAEPGSDAGESGESTTEFVKLNNQFIVPVVEGGIVRALVILSISLEVKAGTTQSVYNYEPKLRDSFLRVLFDHANAGGFDGAFTSSNTMDVLRMGLMEAATGILSGTVGDVLITDIVRQDN